MADAAENAQNQALRFANALRWERGQRKEAEERSEGLAAVRLVLSNWAYWISEKR